MTNSIEKLDLSAALNDDLEWELITLDETFLSARIHPIAAPLNKYEIVIMGGQSSITSTDNDNCSGSSTYRNDVVQYDTFNDEWQLLVP